MPHRHDVRVGTLMPIPALLREHGSDPRRTFAAVGLDLAEFDHPDRRVPFAKAGALLDACARETGVAHFALLVASRFALSQLGLLAQLMRNSGTVGDALTSLVRYIHLNDRGAVPYLLDLGQGQTALGYVVYRHDTAGIAHVYDLALGVGCGIMHAVCGPGWKPLQVSLAHARPRDPRPWRRHFGAPVRFDAAHTEIVFASQWLKRAIADADATLRLAAEQAAGVIEGNDARLAPRVQRIVHGLVMAGEATARATSALLGLHERALRRRLHDEGTSFQALLNAARLEIAQQLLQETRLPVSEIAASLHYADATAFSRAFRRAAGTSPSAWRAGFGPNSGRN